MIRGSKLEMKAKTVGGSPLRAVACGGMSIVFWVLAMLILMTPNTSAHEMVNSRYVIEWMVPLSHTHC